MIAGSTPVTSCMVCRSVAARYNFYGTTVCNSCRVFFRRSVMGSCHGAYACKNSSNGNVSNGKICNSNSSNGSSNNDSNSSCSISSRSWKSCRKCRFERCLAVGMNPKWVDVRNSPKTKYKVMC